MGPLPNPDTQALPRPTFDELYALARRHLPQPLLKLGALPGDVDDIVHEVVLIAHGKLDTFVPAAEDPSDPQRSLRAWLFGIAWRYVSRHRARAHRRLEIPIGGAASLAASETGDAPCSLRLAADAQRRVLLMRVLAKLTPTRAEVLVMHCAFEMPLPEISSELGVNENTLKSRLRRAREDALAAVKRLRPDERSALHGCPLLLPFILETSWLDVREEPQAPRWQGYRVAPAAVLGAALVAAMTMGARAGCPAVRDVEVPAIVAVHEAAPIAPTLARTAVAADPVVITVPVATPSPAHARGPASPDDTLAREHALIKDARRALAEHAYDRAAAIVRRLEQEFPHGALATDRAGITRQVVRRREAKLLDL